MEPKWIFGIVCVIVLGAIQVSAFILGIDGQVFAGTTGTITAIIGFLLGWNIVSPAQKATVKEVVETIINKQKPKD